MKASNNSREINRRQCEIGEDGQIGSSSNPDQILETELHSLFSSVKLEVEETIYLLLELFEQTEMLISYHHH